VILITGKKGFLGRYVIDQFQQFVTDEVDYRDMTQVDTLFSLTKPSMVIHLAAKVGGIMANQKSPGTFFYDNMAMNLNILEVSKTYRVKKVVLIASTCCYPALAPVPFKEEDIFQGEPERTNFGYAMAKRAAIAQAMAYRDQFGMNITTLVMANLYGPSDKAVDEESHVIPAMIQKMVQAQEGGHDYVVLWGSGKAKREFLFIEDAARAVANTCYINQENMVINIGSGEEIYISDLAEIIKKEVGFTGEITWDKSRPDGQLARLLDSSLATKAIAFRPRVSLEQGIKRTVAYYRKNSELVQ
jgi:GDP-L-fucose synthase